MSVHPVSGSGVGASEIVGVWKFLGCEILNFDTNEHIAYYMNKAPHGYLCYTEDGYMSFALSGISDNGEDSNNPTDKKHLEQLYFAHADWRKATNEEKAKAFDSFLGYSGKYTYDTEKQIVTHYIEASLYPNWIGEKQERVIRFADKEKNMLLLNTPPAKFPDRPISFYSSIKFSRAVGAVFGNGLNGANAAIQKAQEGERPPCQCIIQ